MMFFGRAALAIALLASSVSAFVPTRGAFASTRRSVITAASTADFKNGLTIEVDNVPFKIVEFMHVKPGKGSAFVRSKIKNLMNGSVQDKTWRAGEKVELANVEKFDMQFTYEDEGTNSFMFMDMSTFEEIAVDSGVVGEKAGYLKDGLEVAGIKWNEKVIDVELPKTQTYTVVDTEPNVKGNTVQGGTKPATIESGAVITVPMFIDIDQVIKVDTESGKYLGKE